MNFVNPNQPLPKLAIALDGASVEPFEPLLDALHGLPILIKVGVSLFTAVGPSVVHHMRLAGFEVFLDLKLHDIPHQIGLAVQVVNKLDVALLTVHAAGGLPMLQAAAQARGRTRVVAVTVLTSLDQEVLAQTGVSDSLQHLVEQRLMLIERAGLDGAVLSPQELPLLRGRNQAMLAVVPGIRQVAGGDDQRRTATAYEAARAGADLLVVGRPIASAREPRAAALEILADIERGQRDRANMGQ